MTPEELAAVEDAVNESIVLNAPVTTEVMARPMTPATRAADRKSVV